MSMIGFLHHVRGVRRREDVVSSTLRSKERRRNRKLSPEAHIHSFLTNSSRLESMERELRELQECVKNSERKEVEKSPGALRSVSPDDSSLDMPEPNYSLEHLTASLRNHNGDTAPRSIAGVELDDSVVADLLQEWVAPILGLR